MRKTSGARKHMRILAIRAQNERVQVQGESSTLIFLNEDYLKVFGVFLAAERAFSGVRGMAADVQSSMPKIPPDRSMILFSENRWHWSFL